MSLKNRNFLKLLDYTPAEIEALLDLALTSRPGRRPASATMPCAAKTSPDLREDLHPHPVQL